MLPEHANWMRCAAAGVTTSPPSRSFALPRGQRHERIGRRAGVLRGERRVDVPDPVAGPVVAPVQPGEDPADRDVDARERGVVGGAAEVLLAGVVGQRGAQGVLDLAARRVAAVLEVAEQLASRPLAGGAALRVGFWGAEELGLIGSDRYVRRLSAAERRRIRAYVNLDMVGSPGEKAAVYTGRGAAGQEIEDALRKGLPPDAPEESLGGASDHASFSGADIPVGGIFTGLDRCYHRACDRLGNVDASLASQNARATADALVALAAR